MRLVTSRTALTTSVIGKIDGFEPDWLRSRWEMTHSADGARIRANRRDRRVHRMSGEWTVATLTTDAGVRVGLAEVGDVAVTLDAGHLPGIHNRPGLVRGNRTSPVRPKPAVIGGHQEPAQSEKQSNSDGKYCREPKQVLVGAESRHDVFFLKKNTRQLWCRHESIQIRAVRAFATHAREFFSSAAENRPLGYYFFKLLR
jgi:hypothetical protein